MQSTIITVVILVILGGILLSLGYGLFYLLYGRGETKRTARGLTIRICLSMALFLALLVAIYYGFIIPNPVSL